MLLVLGLKSDLTVREISKNLLQQLVDTLLVKFA